MVDLLADMAGVSIVAPLGKDPSVLARFNEVPAQEAFEFLSEQVGLTPIYDSGVITFAEPGQQVELVRVIDTGFIDGNFLQEAFKAAAPRLDIRQIPGRVVLAGTARDVEKALLIVHDLQLRDAWLLDVRLVQVSSSMLSQIGIGINAAGRFGARAAAGVGNLPSPALPAIGLDADLFASAVLTAAETSSDATILANGRLFIIEGGEASMQRGDVVPIPQRQTSPEGVVRVVDYTFLETGFRLQAKAHRIVHGVLLELEPEVSAVTGVIEDAPITTRSTVRSSVVIDDGSWVVLSGFEQVDTSRSGSGLPGRSRTRLGAVQDTRDASTELYVLVRATRVWATPDSLSEP